MRATSACAWLAAAALLRCTDARVGWLSRLDRFETSNAHPGVPNCTVHAYNQRLDHFDYSEGRTWRQRYFVHDSHFDGASSSVLFYVGNEANVELYVNSTGLMCRHHRIRRHRHARNRRHRHARNQPHRCGPARMARERHPQVGAREGAARPPHLRRAPLLRRVAATR